LTPAQRERFSASELAVVLSHYDLGVIESAREIPRGSRQSPKVLLKTGRGRYLLKRRAHGRDRPERVAFSHELLRHLRREGFPVPALMGTRDRQESMLQLDSRIYELFEFVDGGRYDGSLEETSNAGKTLAKFHRTVQPFLFEWMPDLPSFHDSDAVRASLNSIPSSTASHDSVVGHEAELLGMTQELYERYDDAAEAVNQAGYGSWPRIVVHGDWHPGNMLFAHQKVCVVLDFDSARMCPRPIDVSNGLLQFSILRGADSPDAWPEYFDVTRMRRFWMGYLSRAELSEPQRRAIPDLMCQSLIAECVFPIAATGSLGQHAGFGVLQMVRRKVRWLSDARERIWKWMRE